MTRKATSHWTSRARGPRRMRLLVAGLVAGVALGAAGPAVALAAADLQITKTDGVATAAPGNGLRYELTFRNVGDQTATNAVITETVPAGATFSLAQSTPGWSSANGDGGEGSTYTFPLGSLPSSSGSASVIFAVTVDNPASAGTASISNAATIADDGASGPDANPSDNSASDTDALIAAPDMVVTMAAGGSNQPGGTLTYTLSTSNVGNQDATGVVLTETVPTGTTFNALASSPGWTLQSGGSYTLAVGNVAAGAAPQSATFAVTIDAAPAPSGRDSVSNTAVAEDDGGNGADPTPANNVASANTALDAAPDLVVTASDGVPSVAPGGGVTYSVGYRNVGNQVAENVVLTEHLPPGTTFDALNSDPAWIHQGSGIYTLAIGSLSTSSASSAPFAVTVDSPAAAGREQITNVVDIADDAANGPDPTPADNSATDNDNLIAAPDLTLSSSDGRTTADRGDLVKYVLTYANAGTQDAAGAVLTEQLPAGTGFDAAQSSAGWTSQGGGTYTLALGSLPSGAPAGSRTFAVRVDQSAPASQTTVDNAASIADDGTSGPDLNPADNSTSDSDTLSGPADTVPPVIEISSPADGQRFVQGAPVAAAYGCKDAASAVSACSGSVPAGAAIGTTALGAHTFTVAAADSAGNRGSRSVSYTVISPGTIERRRAAKATDSGDTVTIDTGFVAACPQAGPDCTGLLKARALIPSAQLHGSAAVKLKRFGHARIALSGDESGRVRFRLARTRAAFLRRVGRVKLRLTAELRRADGKRVTTSRTVTIRLKGRSLRS
jgi:uncharacterized repeat protein (TIGR01451 family)